eukprot:SAG31_NODE_31065_length_372_cov_1.886447_1_plen_64_part_01
MVKPQKPKNQKTVVSWFCLPCECNVCSHSPVTTLQIRAVLSSLAVTTFVPSGLKAAEFTPPLWP